MGWPATCYLTYPGSPPPCKQAQRTGQHVSVFLWKRRLFPPVSYGLRTIFKDRVSPYGDLLTHAGMTSLYNMRLQDIAIFMFKIRNRLLPYNILELFSSSPSNYNLRNSDFHVQRVKTVKYGKHSLRFFGPFLWSKLSMKDRNETSLSRFKANIRRKDLSKLVSDNACKGCHLCDS